MAYAAEVHVTLQTLLLRILPPPAPGRALAGCEWRTLMHIADVLLTDACPVPPEDIADNVDRFLVLGRSKRAWRVRALLQLVEWAPVMDGGRPFSRMSKRERRRLVETKYVDGHGVWAICAKIRYLALLGAYGDSRSHNATGYILASGRRRLRQAERGGAAAVTL